LNEGLARLRDGLAWLSEEGQAMAAAK
jgi:hypothetical protein